MTRCSKVIVDFIFIACEQALHSKEQAEQAAGEHASKQLAARGRGEPIPSPTPHPPSPLASCFHATFRGLYPQMERLLAGQ